MSTFSLETRIQNFTMLRDTTTDFIANLAKLEGIVGASGSRLSQAFRGHALPHETAAPLNKLIDDLESFCRSCDPIPVLLRNPVVIKGLLDEFRHKHAEQRRPVPFSVVMVGPKLFKRVSSGRIETTTSYEDCAAFESGIEAKMAAKILDDMGERDLRYTSITNVLRDPGTISGKLEDFGFTR
jgi:hypothetical protein